MIKPLPDELRNEPNAQVLAWIADKSAHDGVASALIEATKPLGDIMIYCPDPTSYRYVAVATRGVIFCTATGMNSVSVRLHPLFRDRAIRSGAEASPDIGAAWVSFILFRTDWPEHDLRFWVRKAYVFVRETR